MCKPRPGHHTPLQSPYPFLLLGGKISFMLLALLAKGPLHSMQRLAHVRVCESPLLTRAQFNDTYMQQLAHLGLILV